MSESETRSTVRHGSVRFGSARTNCYGSEGSNSYVSSEHFSEPIFANVCH